MRSTKGALERWGMGWQRRSCGRWQTLDAPTKTFAANVQSAPAKQSEHNCYSAYSLSDSLQHGQMNMRMEFGSSFLWVSMKTTTKFDLGCVLSYHMAESLHCAGTARYF